MPPLTRDYLNSWHKYGTYMNVQGYRDAWKTSYICGGLIWITAAFYNVPQVILTYLRSWAGRVIRHCWLISKRGVWDSYIILAFNNYRKCTSKVVFEKYKINHLLKLNIGHIPSTITRENKSKEKRIHKAK